jgi:hypothetical protein
MSYCYCVTVKGTSMLLGDERYQGMLEGLSLQLDTFADRPDMDQATKDFQGSKNLEVGRTPSRTGQVPTM